MSYIIVILPAAKNHTQDAFEYYETVQQNLGDRFLQTIEKQYDELKDHPHHYSFLSAKKDLRYNVVPHFPFIIVFQIKEDSVFVIAIHNTHQNLPKIYI